MTDRARLLGSVALLVALMLQGLFSVSVPRDWQASHSAGDPPSAAVITLASLGERLGSGYAMSLYLQTFDAQAGVHLPMASLSSPRIVAWLDRIGEIAPPLSYPLLLASRIFAEVAVPAQARILLESVHRRFLDDPDRHWPWLAHAVFVARHRLGDQRLAQAYARSLRLHAHGPGVPRWARDMEIFLLADLDEPAAARALLGALIDSGQISDPHELALMVNRAQEFERRIAADERSKTGPERADKPDSTPLSGAPRLNKLQTGE